MHGHVRWLSALVLVALTAGCATETSGLGRETDRDDIQTDGGDVAVPRDASVSDAAWTPEPALDAGTLDASEPDAPGDAGAAPDAAADDADAGSLDAGSWDAGSLDAGLPDAGPPDAGPMDASAPDDAATLGDAGAESDAGRVDPARCPGREHVGDVAIRKAADIALLEGVVCIRGNLTIWHERFDPMPLPFGPIVDLRIVFGDVSFADDQDWDPPRAERLERIEGTLSLGTGRPVALPALVSTGVLMIEPNYLTTPTDIELPALREVRGKIDTRLSHKARVIRLPALERVGGAFTLAASPNLVELHVPNLRVIEGNFQIKRAPSLGVLSFPALEQVEDFSFSESTATDALRAIDLPALRAASRLFIDSRTVERVRLSQLERVEGTLGVREAHKLRTLEMPALARVAQILHVSRAWLLTDLSLPSLTQVASGLIYDCPQLSECIVPALNAQLAPGSGRIRGGGLRADPACATP